MEFIDLDYISFEEMRWEDQLRKEGVRRPLYRGMNQNSILLKRRSSEPDEDTNTNTTKFNEKVECKRQRLEDEMIPDLFQEADPIKRSFFREWWISSKYMRHELKLCGYTISDPTTFFKEAYFSRKWLDTDHIDIAMLLLRERQVKYPMSFGRFNRAILDSNFHELLKLNSIDVMKEYVDGKVFEHGKKWNGCTHVYYPVCTRKHWIAVEVVFSESTMYVYDCDDKVITTSDLEEDLHIASLLIPKLAKLADIFTQDILKIIRVDGLPRQPAPGDCGVYTIKYIEFLSVQEPADQVGDYFMKLWREKLTFDLFTQNFDP